MEAFASDGSLLPEQVWDAPDIPERELRLGRPSGSAMPLVWAHSEHVKLLRSLRDGCVFDMPPQTAERYARGGAESPFTIWRFNHRCRRLAAGTALRVETLAPATVHWSDDGWKTAHDTRTHSTGLGVHVADLPTNGLEKGRTVVFTFHWSSPERWEDADFEVAVA
jgi:glucoamylase